MVLEEIFNKHSDKQVVLSFSNNNDVLITSECFETSSKFYRRSKVRLSQNFELVGYCDSTFHKENNENNIPANVCIMYRTYRGTKLCDYILYIYTGDYSVLLNYKKKATHSSVIKKTYQQLNLNNITTPSADKALWFYPISYGNAYGAEWWFDRNKKNKHVTDVRITNYKRPWFNYYQCINVCLLTVISRHELQSIKEIRILKGQVDDETAKICRNIYKGTYKTSVKDLLIYKNQFDDFKTQLQDMGITVTFK